MTYIRKTSFLVFLTIFFAQLVYSFPQTEKILVLDTGMVSANLKEYLEVSISSYPINDISQLDKSSFLKMDLSEVDVDQPIQWLRFSIHNKAHDVLPFKLSIPLADFVEVYALNKNKVLTRQKSGDQVPLSQRVNKTGRFVTFDLEVPSGSQEIYVKLESISSVSQGARKLTLSGFQFTSEDLFEEIHEGGRPIQILFFGALLVMFLYNLILFFTIRNISYLYYCMYLLGIILFFSSTNGILLEGFFPEYPIFDLYIRFTSVWFLMINFILFGRNYLQIGQYFPKLDKVLKVMVGLFLFFTLLMYTGFWMLGRMSNIFLSMVTFITLLVTAIRTYRKGYKPALYFLIANLLVLTAGVVYAAERILLVIYNPFSQYVMQVALVLEVTLFSIGLAARINLISKQLSEAKLKEEKIEREKEEERRKFIQKQNVELEEKVIERTAEIQQQNEEIQSIIEELQAQNEHITHSIQYAQRIQQAVLGYEADILKKYNDTGEGRSSFILFQPKDIVSGDFYWYAEEFGGDIKSPDKQLFIAADCTGHGVPGAFMTMLGSSALEEIVVGHKEFDPSNILRVLDEKVINTLNKGDQYKGDHSGKITNDGMDMAALVFDYKSNEVVFAGAKNPLLHVHDGEITKIKASKFPIGSVQYSFDKQYENHRIPFEKGDCFYIFSDGYQDQFGGPENRKFLSKVFRALILEISNLPMEEQCEHLQKTISDWKGGYTQTDDILVMGFRV